MNRYYLCRMRLYCTDVFWSCIRLRLCKTIRCLHNHHDNYSCMHRRCFCSLHDGYNCGFSSHIHPCLYIRIRCLQIRPGICIHIHQVCLYTMHEYCSYGSRLCTHQHLDRSAHHLGNLTDKSSCGHQLH